MVLVGFSGVGCWKLVTPSYVLDTMGLLLYFTCWVFLYSFLCFIRFSGTNKRRVWDMGVAPLLHLARHITSNNNQWMPFLFSGFLLFLVFLSSYFTTFYLLTDNCLSWMSVYTRKTLSKILIISGLDRSCYSAVASQVRLKVGVLKKVSRITF